MQCRDASTRVSAEVYYAKTNVPTSMGLLLNRVDERIRIGGSSLDPRERESLANTRQSILHFLEMGAHPGVGSWPAVSWRSDVYPGEDLSPMYLDMGLQCIQGLGISGDEDALKDLEWLITQHLPSVERKLGTPSGQADLKSLGYSRLLMEQQILSSVRSSVESAVWKNKQVHSAGLENYYARAEPRPN